MSNTEPASEQALQSEVNRLKAEREAAREAARRLGAYLIANSPYLDKPYTDKPDESPWSRVSDRLSDLYRMLGLPAKPASEPNPIGRLDEPADGSTVAVYDGRSYVVHWRTDSAADPEHPDERWLCDWSDDPARWSVVLQDAVQVFALGELLAEMPQSSPLPSSVTVSDEVPF